MSTARISVQLVNRSGLHARPAHLFVQTANSFEARVRVWRDGGSAVDGKSIMGMMMLAAENGATLEIESEGPDAEAQTAALRELVESGFGED